MPPQPDQHSVFDVFTPTTPASLNFVPRDAINDQLVDSLRTPGKQVIVYGETGSGKSTLLRKKLEELYGDHITSRCNAATSFDSLLLDAFDQLDRYYLESSTSGTSRSATGQVSADFWKLKASVQGQMLASASVAAKRVIPPQLTAQRLGQFMGARGLCWVIEDFHKVPEEQKPPLAQTLKIFSDLGSEYRELKVIAVGATDTAREVVKYDLELSNRVAEILVPLMSRQELGAILDNGQELLNVDLSSIRSDVVTFAVGLGSVCHHIALNVCLERDIQVTQAARLEIVTPDLEPAIKRYVSESSDTLKAAFDMALRRHKVRRFDNTRLILTALASGPSTGLLYSEILQSIRRSEPSYPAGNLTVYLRQLAGVQRASLLRQGTDGGYRFAEPLYQVYAQAVLDVKPTRDLSSEFLNKAIRDTLSRLIPALRNAPPANFDFRFDEAPPDQEPAKP